MLLILAIVFAILAFSAGIIGVVGLFFTVGIIAVVGRISRLLFPALALMFVVFLLLLIL